MTESKKSLIEQLKDLARNDVETDAVREMVTQGLLPPEALPPEERELFRPFDEHTRERLHQHVLAQLSKT